MKHRLQPQHCPDEKHANCANSRIRRYVSGEYRRRIAERS